MKDVKVFLKNKQYMVSLFFFALAGYAYVFTHGTCGRDDISIDIYFKKGLGVAIGRWPYYLVNKVIPIAKYTPFIGDFITVLVLMVAAIAWCTLLYKLLPKNVTIWAYIVFSALFLDYSMNAEDFIFYLQNGLGWFHLFVVISLLAFLYIFKNSVPLKKQLLIRMGIILLLSLAISFYESAANIFLTGILVIVCIDLFVEGKASSFRGKRFWLALFFATRYLVYAMVVRRLVRAILMRMFSIPAYTFYRSVSSIEWLTKGGIGNVWKNIGKLLAMIWCDYFAVSVVYYPILLFAICSLLFVGAIIYIAYKRKDGLLFFTSVCLYGSMFVLCLVEGTTMFYRACQIFTVFVALVGFGAVAVLARQKRWVRNLGGVLVATALIYSIYDLNHWFALDYEKTEYEMQVIDQIAADLNSGAYNVIEKPLVFVGDFVLPDEIYDKFCVKDSDIRFSWVKAAAELAGKTVENSYVYAQNDGSIIDWSVKAFAMYCGYNVPIRQFFEYRGYQFKWAEEDTIKQVFKEYYPLDFEYYCYTYVENYEETYQGKAEYPENGYIEEREDCIIIRL